jgi:transketolase
VPELQWTDLDRQAVDTARVLAMDAVQQVGNGHPGTAMSLAPAAYLLYQHHLRHDPADPEWIGRDRFVLSCGHSSLTLYVQLYLSGYDLTLDDLKALRTWQSRTPGHPERAPGRRAEIPFVPGVEATTGPLGQGVANAVGMAMSARRVRGLLDPEPDLGESPFDHRVYCFASDGDLQEGVSAEASSLAATQRLGNLIVVWDDNEISIEDATSIAFSEDVAARYAAYGWHVQTVDWRSGDEYHEDVAALHHALLAAEAETTLPSFIQLRTIIGWPSPGKKGTGKAHGAALGVEEVAATKRVLGWDPDRTFHVPDDALVHARDVARRGAAAHARWDAHLAAWRAAQPDGAALLDRLQGRELPAGWDADLPRYQPGEQIATRKASGDALTALAPRLPELWGGSADLAESNNTTPKGEPSFFPPDRASKEFPGGWYGRVLHFGIREHAMGAILNGMALDGLTLPYGGTFLVFSDYMRPSVRLAALMGLPVTYVWTHDSIGLGEDGPTHQPIEHLASLRAVVGLHVVRPADATETVGAWAEILRRHTTDEPRPAGLCLTRQTVPVLAGTDAGAVGRGAYVLRDAPDGRPDAVVLATGSEVQLALAAQDLLAGEIGVRVVSAPCLEWFAEQDQGYRDAVLPPGVRARVSVEAGVAQPWWRWLGDAGVPVSLERYGSSADPATLFRELGFTPEAVADAVRASLARARG